MIQLDRHKFSKPDIRMGLSTTRMIVKKKAISSNDNSAAATVSCMGSTCVWSTALSSLVTAHPQAWHPCICGHPQQARSSQRNGCHDL